MYLKNLGEKKEYLEQEAGVSCEKKTGEEIKSPNGEALPGVLQGLDLIFLLLSTVISCYLKKKNQKNNDNLQPFFLKALFLPPYEEEFNNIKFYGLFHPHLL